MSRPKYATNKDENHSIPREFLKWQCGRFEPSPAELNSNGVIAYTANYRGYRVLLIDYSAIGGVITDYYIEVYGTAAWIEVKTKEAYKKKDNSLTKGEQWLYQNCNIDFYIVTDDKDFRDALDEMIDSHE